MKPKSKPKEKVCEWEKIINLVYTYRMGCEGQIRLDRYLKKTWIQLTWIKS